MKKSHGRSDKITRSMLEPKPKKKKPSTDLVVVTSDNKKLKKLDRTTQKNVKSYFEESSSIILTMLDDNNNDGAMTLLKKKLLQTTVNVLPKAEQILQESGTTRGVYQFTTLLNSIRELISDIQADTDRKYIARSLMESIMRPMFMDLAQYMMTEHHSFRKTCERMIKTEHTQEFNHELQALAKTMAGVMMEKYKDVELKVTEALKN